MQKFIITKKGDFRYGNVRMHKDLLQAGDMCFGGGFYEFDYVGNRLLLTGKSYDFGAPEWAYVDKVRLPAVFRGMQVRYEDDDLHDLVNVEYVWHQPYVNICIPVKTL